ncbi:MarR family winged helix-turn-helix transcriptional regulator [Paenibacillus aquistagni]|uniref:DNA-binding transcriptional regulator, MarR family n=1 Tax=Paenibacillus aquistagni TaxID=1852522 RepID=A0A1X7LJ07_9BACL|nr:MarR family winged helix-turn-helix transcriptional regulator [Paenibacillus aquistagni]NMM55289.1 winged helix-turn-helix transcriptional regulator [Paenibacillus aquistagni]SMG53841.1 DNA-binding transcriptional regulator, MarR family [Paenibacillus aquistagni]
MPRKDFAINPRAYISFSDQIKQFYQDEMSKLAAVELKPSQARMLHFLADFEGLHQREACEIFGVGASTMSEMLTGMEKEGYIWREVNPQNKRMIFIRLTDKGREAAERIRALFDDYCLSFMEHFTADEIREFERLLLKFSRS